MNNRKHLKTGGDPRSFPDYAALRDEMMKLSHPARPDVNWQLAETLCLRLFEHNGVELQSAAWYTLARMHIAGVIGMNEGLTLINALVAHQWSVMWPTATHGRMEILSVLSQRLQSVFRTLALHNGGNLKALYQADKHLSMLGDTLARHELRQAGRTDMLLQQVRQAITRLENMPQGESHQPEIMLPAQALQPLPDLVTSAAERLVYVVQPDSRVEVAMTIPSKNPRPVVPFLSGVGVALAIGAVVQWGWTTYHARPPHLQQLNSSVASLPAPLSTEQRAQLNQTSPLTVSQAEAVMGATRQHLQWLQALPPDWSQQRAQAVLAQLQSVDPRNEAVTQLQKTWRQQVEANALPLSALNSWHDGMKQLQVFADKLNALDSKRGKYLTVSELKSEVFTITQMFNKNPPLEEHLRRLDKQNASDNQFLAQQAQSKIKLNQMINRYYLLVEAE